MSVDLLGVRPRRQACDEVELSQEATDDLIDVILRAELLELSNDTGERGVDFGDRVLGIVLTLPLEAPLMFDELFPIKSGATRDVMHARWPGLFARVSCGGASRASARLIQFNLARSRLSTQECGVSGWATPPACSWLRRDPRYTPQPCRPEPPGNSKTTAGN